MQLNSIKGAAIALLFFLVVGILVYVLGTEVVAYIAKTKAEKRAAAAKAAAAASTAAAGE